MINSYDNDIDKETQKKNIPTTSVSIIMWSARNQIKMPIFNIVTTCFIVSNW